MTGEIVRAAIHPGLGIARLGTSDTDLLLAPQTPFPPRRAADSSHDAEGRLKREAVEFRVYGYDADGKVVAELTAENADITWRAHVANAKAAWFKFRHPMDVPSLAATVVQRRNPEITDPEARRKLIIDPGPRSISGRAQGGAAAHRFDTGTFQDTPVFLGELRTDARGRLLFLPGLGHSGSPAGLPPYVEADEDGFGNAAGWFDDIADGPVDADVVIEGRVIPTEGAWVASAPPNFAPDLKAWRSIYDLVQELYAGQGWRPWPSEVSFTREVYPLLARLTALQWTNKALAAVFGHGAPFDFDNADLLDRLGRIHGAKDVYRPLRTAIARMFRTPGDGRDPSDWPWFYGDSFGSGPENDPHTYFMIGGERLRILSAWADGKFVADWSGEPPPQTIDALSLAEQPPALDRAALEFCAADAFHPGIELTWPLRHASLWSAPFRVARATRPEPDYGRHLDVPRVLGEDGPLRGQFAGSLTRWMLLPWQIDTGGCLAGYDDKLAYDAPSFWPARVPNHVLTQEDYSKVLDNRLSESDRREAFAVRQSWFATLGVPSRKWGEELIARFGGMGIVEAREPPGDLTDLPSPIYVATVPKAASPARTQGLAAPQGEQPPLTEADRNAQAAGFADEADRQAMRRMRFGR